MNLRQAVTVLACLLIVCGAVRAEEMSRQTLPNGMTVVIQEAHGSPTVSLNLFVRAGSLYETPETSGLSHFYEHMFYRGTPTRTGWQFKRSIEALGGSTNATTGRDFTHFYINLPAEYANDGLELLSDALKNAELKPDGIDLERKAVLEEYRIGQSSPTRLLYDKLFELAYGQHPYVRSVIGTESNLKRFSRPDFVAFKSRFYVPSRTHLVVVGDVDTDRTMSTVRRLFGDFQGTEQGDPAFVLPPWPTSEQETVDTVSLSRTYVLMAFRGPSVKDRPDVYQTDVMTFMLGIGRGSLLSKALVDTKLAEQVNVDFLTQREKGLIIAVAVGAPGDEPKFRKAMLDTIERIKVGDFTEQDLKRAKTLLTNTYTFGNETNAGKADSLGFYESIDVANFAVKYLDEVRKVDRQGVVAAARKYFTPGYYVLVARPEGSGPAGDDGPPPMPSGGGPIQ